MVIFVLLLPAQIGFFNKCSVFGLNIFDLPVKQTKWIRHKLIKLMKSSPNYNVLQ